MVGSHICVRIVLLCLVLGLPVAFASVARSGSPHRLLLQETTNPNACKTADCETCDTLLSNSGVGDVSTSCKKCVLGVDTQAHSDCHACVRGQGSATDAAKMTCLDCVQAVPTGMGWTCSSLCLLGVDGAVDDRLASSCTDCLIDEHVRDSYSCGACMSLPASISSGVKQQCLKCSMEGSEGWECARCATAKAGPELCYKCLRNGIPAWQCAEATTLPETTSNGATCTGQSFCQDCDAGTATPPMSDLRDACHTCVLTNSVKGNEWGCTACLTASTDVDVVSSCLACVEQVDSHNYFACTDLAKLGVTGRMANLGVSCLTNPLTSPTGEVYQCADCMHLDADDNVKAQCLGCLEWGRKSWECKPCAQKTDPEARAACFLCLMNPATEAYKCQGAVTAGSPQPHPSPDNPNPTSSPPSPSTDDPVPSPLPEPHPLPSPGGGGSDVPPVLPGPTGPTVFGMQRLMDWNQHWRQQFWTNFHRSGLDKMKYSYAEVCTVSFSIRMPSGSFSNENCETLIQVVSSTFGKDTQFARDLSCTPTGAWLTGSAQTPAPNTRQLFEAFNSTDVAQAIMSSLNLPCNSTFDLYGMGTGTACGHPYVRFSSENLPALLCPPLVVCPASINIIIPTTSSYADDACDKLYDVYMSFGAGIQLSSPPACSLSGQLMTGSVAPSPSDIVKLANAFNKSSTIQAIINTLDLPCGSTIYMYAMASEKCGSTYYTRFTQDNYPALRCSSPPPPKYHVPYNDSCPNTYWYCKNCDSVTQSGALQQVRPNCYGCVQDPALGDAYYACHNCIRSGVQNRVIEACMGCVVGIAPINASRIYACHNGILGVADANPSEPLVAKGAECVMNSTIPEWGCVRCLTDSFASNGAATRSDCLDCLTKGLAPWACLSCAAKSTASSRATCMQCLTLNPENLFWQCTGDTAPPAQ